VVPQQYRSRKADDLPVAATFSAIPLLVELGTPRPHLPLPVPSLRPTGTRTPSILCRQFTTSTSGLLGIGSLLLRVQHQRESLKRMGILRMRAGRRNQRTRDCRGQYGADRSLPVDSIQRRLARRLAHQLRVSHQPRLKPPITPERQYLPLAFLHPRKSQHTPKQRPRPPRLPLSHLSRPLPAAADSPHLFSRPDRLHPSPRILLKSSGPPVGPILLTRRPTPDGRQQTQHFAG